jgi:hypothetical protein
MSLTVADNQGLDPNEEERKAKEAATPPVNPPYPFTMITFPYALVGFTGKLFRKEELTLLGID